MFSQVMQCVEFKSTFLTRETKFWINIAFEVHIEDSLQYQETPIKNWSFLNQNLNLKYKLIDFF